MNKRIIGIFIVLFIMVLIGSSVVSKISKEANIYNSFFYGLLKNTDINTSKELIESVGLEAKTFIVLANTGYWGTGNEYKNTNIGEYNNIYEKINHINIIELYFKNPMLLIRNINYGLSELKLSSAKARYIGNLTKSESYNNSKTVVNTILGSKLNYIYIHIYILSVFICIFVLKKDKNNITSTEKTILLLTFITPLIFGVNIVGDGFYEFIKHSLSFYYSIVLLLVTNILYLTEIIIHKNNKVSSKTTKTTKTKRVRLD